MVADWRKTWFAESGRTMDKTFPFGQVQVATPKVFFNYNYLGKGWVCYLYSNITSEGVQFRF